MLRVNRFTRSICLYFDDFNFIGELFCSNGFFLDFLIKEITKRLMITYDM